METQHCPGFESNKSLRVHTCKCQKCGKENEIFSDELNKKHKCQGCGHELDVIKCDCCIQ
jgi:hypothetical protein